MRKNNSEYLINRKDNQYEVVIGLEVHAQVTSESKLFSSSSTMTSLTLQLRERVSSTQTMILM